MSKTGYNIIWRKRLTTGTWAVLINSIPATDTEKIAALGDYPIAGNGYHYFRIENSAIPGVYCEYPFGVYLHI